MVIPMDYGTMKKKLLAKMHELDLNRINPSLAMAILETSSPAVAKAVLEYLTAIGVFVKDGKEYVFKEPEIESDDENGD